MAGNFQAQRCAGQVASADWSRRMMPGVVRVYSPGDPPFARDEPEKHELETPPAPVYTPEEQLANLRVLRGRRFRR